MKVGLNDPLPVWAEKDTGLWEIFTARHRIDHIVIDERYRHADLYRLNESLLRGSFKSVYEQNDILVLSTH